MDKNIILFGMMGSGKDSVAEILTNYGYSIAKLGRRIRNNVNLYNYNEKPCRDLYQRYGQACREIFGADVWNEQLSQEIELDFMGEKWVIADGRQLNELDYWTNKGYISIGVIADSDIRRQRLIERDRVDQVEYFLHDTERQAAECIEKCQYRLVNNYPTKRELEWAVCLLMERIRREHENTNSPRID